MQVRKNRVWDNSTVKGAQKLMKVDECKQQSTDTLHPHRMVHKLHNGLAHVPSHKCPLPWG